MKKITLLIASFFAITLTTFSQVQIGTDTGTTTNLPITSCYGYTYSQQLFLASEINTSGDITSLSFYLDPATSTENFASSVDWVVYLGHSSKTEFTSTSDWEVIANLTQSYSGTVTFPLEGNWFTLTLDTPFAYNGTDNLIVGVDENTSGYNCSMYWQRTLTANSRSIYYYSDGTNPDPSAPPTGTLASLRSNVIFGGIVQACPFPSALTATNITTTQADLSWTENGSASMYNVEIVTAGSTPTGVATDTGVANPFTKSGLSTGTAFEYYVQADCGGGELSSWSGPFAFTTLCVSVTSYPFLESFEGITSGQPPCWSVEGTTTNATYHFSSYATGYSGRGMRFNSYVNSNGLTSELISPIFDASALSSLELKFYYKNPTGGNFEILVSSDGGANYTSIANSLVGQTNWIQMTYDLTSYISGNMMIKFFGTSNYGNGDAYIYLDEVLVREIPSCLEPTALTVSNLSINSADFGWTPSGSETAWDIELVDVTAGGSPTGTPTSTGVANPYTQGGLTANNSYQYYVRADCAGDASPWAGPYNFITLCEALSVPFSEGFNSDSTTENCWTVLNENGDADAWDMNYATNPYEGDQTAMIYTDYNDGNNDDWLISPGLTLTGNERLKFHSRVQSSGEPNNFEVLLSTTGIAPADFTNVLMADADYSNTTYVEYEVNLSAYSGTSYIAFHVPAGGLDGWRLYIDDVIIETLPTCIEPSALTVSNITTTTADFGWTLGGSETLWDIELVDVTAGGTATGNPTSTDVGNPYTQEGLIDSNNYEFYVRANCESGGYSVWVGPYSFLTVCEATVIPYSVDFQNSTSTPDCTSIINDGSGNVWQVVAATGYGFTPNHLRYTYNSANPANTWFFTQGLDLTGGQAYTITYDYGGTGTTFPEALKVAYGTSNDSASMTNVIADYPNVVNDTPITESQDFTPATSGIYYIGFQAYSEADNFYLHLDNILIEESSLSVADFELTGFSYFPNPVNNILNLKGKNSIQNVAIFNLLGQEVLRTAPKTLESEIDMSNLQTGTYFVKVTIENATKTIKVIKK